MMPRLAGLTLIVVHVAGLASVWLVPPSWSAVGLCLSLYYLRMFAITAGFHRLFSHRSYRTSRAMRFVLAWLGTAAIQRGPIWWTAVHRHHHRHSDKPQDLHSPVQHGLWQAHLGWVLKPENRRIDRSTVADLTCHPEMEWLDRHYLVPPLSLAAICFFVFGAEGLVWGFFISTILLWHGTFTINSLSHRFGTRPFNTRDDSRNNFLLALLTMGEGWHNNHHFYPASARQGFRAREVDISYLILRIFEALGLVWDVRRPSPEMLARGRMAARNRLPEAGPD